GALDGPGPLGQAAAQASSRSACATQARTRNCPSGSSAALIATAVCEALRGSTPIITAAIGTPLSWTAGKTVTGTPNSRTLRHSPLLSHATARPQRAGTSFGSQTQQGAAGGTGARPAGTSQRYDLTHCHPGQDRTVYPKSQLGGTASVLFGFPCRSA